MFKIETAAHTNTAMDHAPDELGGNVTQQRWASSGTEELTRIKDP